MGVGTAGHEPRDDLDDVAEDDPAGKGGKDGESVEHGSALLECRDELAGDDRADGERDGVDEPFETDPWLPDQLRGSAEDQRSGDDQNPASKAEGERKLHRGPPSGY